MKTERSITIQTTIIVGYENNTGFSESFIIINGPWQVQF